MKIGIADTAEQADQNAWDARAAEARAQTMAKLIAGHAVEVVADDSDTTISLRVGDVVFKDEREAYPSEALVANVALAVDAARFSPDAFTIGDFDAEDLKRFDPRYRADARWVARLKQIELDEQATCNIRREATKRGQRPLSDVELLAGGIKW